MAGRIAARLNIACDRKRFDSSSMGLRGEASSRNFAALDRRIFAKAPATKVALDG
jgi:hypothetical protein